MIDIRERKRHLRGLHSGTKICQIFLSIQIMPRHVFPLFVCVCKIRRTTEIKRHNKLRNEENRKCATSQNNKLNAPQKNLNLFLPFSFLLCCVAKKNSFVMTNPLCAHIKMQCSAWKETRREKIIFASFHFHV
jgi:hypothetical protein